LLVLVVIGIAITVSVKELGYDKVSPFSLLTLPGIVFPNVMGTCGMLLAVVAGLDFGNPGRA
jgi:hypothetical protein